MLHNLGDATGATRFRIMYRRAFILCCAALPLTALGHHSGSANFIVDSIITVKGVVTEYRFQNPHVQILLDVTNDDGEVEHWMVELAAKNQFVRAGWVGDEFEPGQTITVEGWEGRRPRSTFLQKAIMEDGTEVLPPRLVDGRAPGPGAREPEPEPEPDI